MKKIYLITKNIGKLEAAKSAFSKFNIEIKSIDKEYPEIQANTSLEIARFTALQAAKEFNLPVIREDHSLFINHLSGFPGPYTSYFDKKIPVEKLLELMKDAKDRTGYFEVATVYAKPNGETKEHVFRVPIKLSDKIHGNVRNWDKLLMLKDSNKTFAELKETDNVNVWNKNYLLIARDISERTHHNNTTQISLKTQVKINE